MWTRPAYDPRGVAEVEHKSPASVSSTDLSTSHERAWDHRPPARKAQSNCNGCDEPPTQVDRGPALVRCRAALSDGSRYAIARAWHQSRFARRCDMPVALPASTQATAANPNLGSPITWCALRVAVPNRLGPAFRDAAGRTPQRELRAVPLPLVRKPAQHKSGVLRGHSFCWFEMETRGNSRGSDRARPTSRYSPRTREHHSISARKRRASCGAAWGMNPICWTAVTDSILTVDTLWGTDDSEYAVLGADVNELHRNRFAEGYSRIVLRTGESLQLLAGVSDPITLDLKAVRPLAEGAQPELDERCRADENESTLCFAVSTRNYHLTLVVLEQATDSPTYKVVDQHGNVKHQGRFETGNFSNIYIEAGDQLQLDGPNWRPLSAPYNEIKIMQVQQY